MSGGLGPTFINANNKGVYSTFFNLFANSTQLANVTVLYGEENTVDNNGPPFVCIYPTRGVPSKNGGYVMNQDPQIQQIWMFHELFNITIWGYSDDVSSQEVDHADAANHLCAKVLSALYSHQAQLFSFRIVSRNWDLFNNAKTRMGRRIDLVVEVDVSVLYEPLVFDTITSVPITASIDDS